MSVYGHVYVHVCAKLCMYADLGKKRSLLISVRACLSMCVYKDTVAPAAGCLLRAFSGQNYFEALLSEHPKRTDLISQYLDAFINAHTPPVREVADLPPIRRLFEKVTSFSLKPRKMKFLFYPVRREGGKRRK